MGTRHIAKIMLNSAYGKFAQRPDRFRDYAFMPADIATTKTWQQAYLNEETNLSIWERPSAGFGTYYNVATAASITGFVRSCLLRAIAQCNPYYCDTDSVIVYKGHVPSPIGDSLGNWSLECEGDRLYIAGKKMYAFRLIGCDSETAKKKGYYWDGEHAWKMATKGARLLPGEVLRMCQGETITWENAAPTFSLKDDVKFLTRRLKMTK
jgi:hypothetical protein